jgi:peptidase E
MPMNIALTSDWPSTASQQICDFIRVQYTQPRIAWIPPFTASGQEYFPTAKKLFAANGFVKLEYFDIDEKPNTEQLAMLANYDVVYLSGGDPIGFRSNILKSGVSAKLQQCLARGCYIVAASGGSMQLTKNVSLFRLFSVLLDEVIAERSEYNALGVVGYEILPHLNRFDATFLELVRSYSEQVGHDVLALADGAALLYTHSDSFQCLGRVIRFRKGVVTDLG